MHPLMPREMVKQRVLTGLCEELELDVDGDGRIDVAGLAAGSKERKELAGKILAKGFGTNYTPSWFLTRWSVKTDFDRKGNIIVTPDAPVTQIGGSIGPMRRRHLERSSRRAGVIPAVADGTATGKPAAKLIAALGEDRPQGSPLVPAQTGGPVYWNAKNSVFIPLLAGTVLVPADLADEKLRPFCEDRMPEEEDAGDGGMDGKLWMQDTRQWQPHHRGAGRSVLPVLFMDGSVRNFTDLNGDGFLNPGFPVGEKGSDWFADATVELPPAEIFLGPCDSQSLPYKNAFE
jgi:hypothetical protein